jgi:hypothetical protein
LPLVISGDISSGVIAALGQSNRVCQVDLRPNSLQLEEVLATMQVSFPELAFLRLSSFGKTLPVIPDSFLGGSAPRLQILSLNGISFPGLSNLLMSATRLVELTLTDIPHSGCILPEAMVAPFSVLSTLKVLSLRFRPHQSPPDWESRSLPRPPSKRSILPILRKLSFEGNAKYLEGLVTFMDAPQLVCFQIDLFNQIDFDTPRLAQLINRTPTLGAFDETRLRFGHRTAGVLLRYRITTFTTDDLRINLSCCELDWQLLSVAKLCNSLHPLSTIEDLHIKRQYLEAVRMDDYSIENTVWLQLLLPFTAVKNLYLDEEFVPVIVATLQELVVGRITEVLPSLQNVILELEPSGGLEENIRRFVAGRQLAGRPITISVRSLRFGNM